MDGVSRVGVLGPLRPYAAGFATELARLGYASLSADGQLRLAAHLSRWLAGEGLDAGALTPAVVAEFLAARRAAGYTAHRSPKSLAPLLGYLRGLGVMPEPAPPPAEGPVEVLLEWYRRYLLGERGLGPATARGYVDLVRPFLLTRATDAGVDLAGLQAADVVGFVLALGRDRSSKMAQGTVSALRSLLRFCHVQGLAGPLAAAVPKVANRRPTPPRFLETIEVEALLASCDRGGVAGRRDFAMITLMVRLGLRAGEVAALGLGDIDWRGGEVTVLGKGPRSERLPLPADVGAAIADYLRHARPARAIDRRVFLRVEAPHTGLTPTGVTQAVIAAGRRAGLGPVTAHRLRHSAGTGMLRAGASLAQVGQVLRHRRAATTESYATVDHDRLRTLARPWPGGAA